jgi:hypothetical protein
MRYNCRFLVDLRGDGPPAMVLRSNVSRDARWCSPMLLDASRALKLTGADFDIARTLQINPRF